MKRAEERFEEVPEIGFIDRGIACESALGSAVPCSLQAAPGFPRAIHWPNILDPPEMTETSLK